MPLTVGQWQTIGSAGFSSSLWRAASPPVAPYRTMADGTVVTAGQTMIWNQQTPAGGSTDPVQLWAYAIGGAYDSDRERFIATGSSGHLAGGSAEVNEFICSTGAWVRQVDPPVELLVAKNGTWPSQIAYAGIHQTGPLALIDWQDHYTANALVGTAGGAHALYPNATQQYGCTTYIPAPYGSVFWQAGGVAQWDPNFACSMISTYDPAAKKWQVQDAEQGHWGGSNGGGTGFPGGACWDSTYHRVLWNDWNEIWAYNHLGTPGAKVTRLTTRGLGDVNDENTALWDPVRKRLWLFGGNNQRYYDFSAGPTSPVEQTFSWGLTVGGTAYPNHVQGEGILYDSLRDRFVYAPFDTTKTLIAINPVTLVATDITPSAGIAPAALSLVSHVTYEHMYGRFFYVRSQDAYMALVNPTDATAFAFQPAAVASTLTPLLVATDLKQGRNNNNPDTAFGQTANVDGAYVTVFGMGLGDTQGTSTLTLGGATPRIISWGRAEPPLCPADLYNQYEKLHAITFQIVSTTPTGLGQPLAVTVGGVASVALGFDVVNTGTIRIVTSGVQAALDAMVGGDVTYVQSTTIPGGVGLGNSTQSPAGPLTLVAYPGASVTIGDTTHDAFPVTASGGGGNVTLAKFSIRGSTANGAQAVTLREDGRLVACNVQVPGGNGSSGAVGIFGSRLAIFGNELTNIGVVGGTVDDQYHVIYRYGRRGQNTMVLEAGCEIAYNYIHDNNSASRAINCFNRNLGNGTAGNIDNPIGDHHIHHNVIVNQQWAGIGILSGCVGTNRVHDNLLVNCGLSNDPGPSAPAIGMELHPFVTVGYTDPAITLDLSHNTLVNCGSASSSTRGALQIKFTTSYTYTMRNNLIYQGGGLPYVSGDSDIGSTPAPSLRSNNCWFGAGAAPAFDSATVTGDPKFVSTVAPLDFHLQTGSSCIGTGVALGSATTFDIDGQTRPASTAPDIGMDQYVATIGPTGTNVSIMPPSMVEGGTASSGGGGGGGGPEIIAASLSATDVLAAMNAATAGYTVRLPAGTGHWAQNVSWNAPANVRLMGAGSLTTTGGGDQTIIIDDFANNASILSVAPNPAGTFRMAGITFRGGSGLAKFNGLIGIDGNCANIRIDHVHIDTTTYSPAVTSGGFGFGGTNYGVIDHCIFDNPPHTVNNSLRFLNQRLVNGDTLGLGDKAFATTCPLGSAQFMFVEDCVLNHGFGNDASGGGSFVFRYNTFLSSSPSSCIQTHGTGSGSRLRGGRAWEIYGNTASAIDGAFAFFYVTSGTGVIWNNTVAGGSGAGFGSFVSGHAVRYDNSTYGQSAPPAGWGYAGTHQTGTASAWDQNTDATGYAAIDQIGRGEGDLLINDFPNTVNQRTGTVAWPQQVLAPVYEWGNAYTGPSGPGTIWNQREGTVLVAPNRDYYLGTTDAGPPISFNGTVGCGKGLLANRPTTCTPRVGYFATDTNTLYVCTATNTWTAFYTPYIYPHPLVS